MLRLLTAIIVIAGFSAAQAADIDCKVKSKKYPSLEKGWNKKVLCEDLTEALENKLGEKIVTAKIRAKDTWMRAYSVGIKFKVKVNGQRYKGQGVQYWNPEDNTFVIDHIQ